MFATRVTVLATAILVLIEYDVALLGQDRGSDASVAEKSEAEIDLADPRVTELKRAYQERIRKLREGLIADIERLGTVKAPTHLEFVDKTKGKWTWSGSIGGFANHSVRIKASDVAETGVWHHCADVPPLQPRDAIAIADETMRKWFDGDKTTFELQRISLVPLLPKEGKWYWEAIYEVSQGRVDKELTLAVRMDGKILTTFNSK